MPGSTINLLLGFHLTLVYMEVSDGSLGRLKVELSPKELS
jgi:hypothetical protein